MAGGDAVVAVQWLNRKAAKKAAERGEAPPDSAGPLEQLLWEQRQANKMLWLMLTDDQRSQFAQMG